MRRGTFAVLLSLMVQGAFGGQNAPVQDPGSEKVPAGLSLNLYLCPPCVSWDSRMAAHLMRRAGFSASPQELDRLVEIGFEATLDKLLNYEEVDDGEMEEALDEEPGAEDHNGDHNGERSIADEVAADKEVMAKLAAQDLESAAEAEGAGPVASGEPSRGETEATGHANSGAKVPG